MATLGWLQKIAAQILGLHEHELIESFRNGPPLYVPVRLPSKLPKRPTTYPSNLGTKGFLKVMQACKMGRFVSKKSIGWFSWRPMISWAIFFTILTWPSDQCVPPSTPPQQKKYQVLRLLEKDLMSQKTK